MPILQVMGLSQMDPESEADLTKVLAQAVASVSAMNLSPAQVTPFLLWSNVEPLNVNIIVVNFVGLLYKPERTLEVLHAVAEQVSQALVEWMDDYTDTLSEQVTIEIIIDPLGKPKPDEYIYYSIVWVQPE